jgi:hypothetical protein
MTRVDLDALDQLGYLFEGDDRQRVWDAVNELRAAREVVEASRAIVAPTIPHERRWTELRRALNAYDQAVES